MRMNMRTFTRPQIREIQRRMTKEGKRKIKNINAYNRLLALSMRAEGKNNKEISKIIGVSASHITVLVRRFLNEGLDAVLDDKRTTNNRRMSFEQESIFLDTFLELANAGQIVTVNGILCKFEEITGKKSNTSTIYKLLERHGWRKVMPRPCHPNKPNEADIEASKKLTENSTASCWKKIELTAEISAKSTAE
jgi:transposase